MAMERGMRRGRGGKRGGRDWREGRRQGEDVQKEKVKRCEE